MYKSNNFAVCGITDNLAEYNLIKTAPGMEIGFRYPQLKRRIFMQDKVIKKDHNIILENRGSMSISGITDVDSFDEKAICLYTQMGELTIQGRELHIDSMSVETGDMTITGDIWSIVYGDRDKKGPISALGRLFR